MAPLALSSRCPIFTLNTPKLSVLIPTYNYARFLPEAIESVLVQDFQDFEVIIVDDNSPDNTAEVVAPYCRKDSRVSFEVNAVNRGMVQNWNYCLSKARGTYVKYLFGDDKLATPKCLGKMVALLDVNPTARLAVSARKVIDENSRWIDVWDNLESDGLYDGRSTIMRCFARNMNLIGEPSAVLFRAADAQRGFSLEYRQLVDMEMWFHLLEQGGLVFTSEPLCCFRKHGQQQTAVNQAAKVGEREMVNLLLKYATEPWVCDEGAIWTKCGLLRTMRRADRTLPGSGLGPVINRYRLDLGFMAPAGYNVAFRIWKIVSNTRRSIRKRAIRARARKG